MSKLLAQVQQLLAGALSQSLTTTQLSQILSTLATGSSTDSVPSSTMPLITSFTLAINPPPTITFSPVSTVSHLISVFSSVQETSPVPVEDVPALSVSDILVQPLISPLVYSLTSGKFLTSCLLLDFLSFVFVLGSLLSADTTVQSSLSVQLPLLESSVAGLSLCMLLHHLINIVFAESALQYPLLQRHLSLSLRLSFLLYHYHLQSPYLVPSMLLLMPQQLIQFLALLFFQIRSLKL